MKALIFESFGGPEVLQYKDIAEPKMGDEEIIVQMKAIGLNFADIYRRKGNYHLAGNPPYILGYEGAGIVERVGRQVSDIQVGDRVAFADVPYANAERVVVPIEKAIPVPESISFQTAAALLLQGLTAQYLTNDSYLVRKGDIILIHAAAGGVGQLLVQIALKMGGTVIGLTSSQDKANVVMQIGAQHVFLYDEDWKEKVLQVTDGKGVHVVYESVGSTILDSFHVTRVRGTVVFYGMSGGDPMHIDPRMLMDTSKTLTGGDLWNVLTSREERLSRSATLFKWVEDGSLHISEPTTYPLSQGEEAHRYLESRMSTGKILLTLP